LTTFVQDILQYCVLFEIYRFFFMACRLLPYAP